MEKVNFHRIVKHVQNHYLDIRTCLIDLFRFLKITLENLLE
jgi:hypothetical protein